MCDNSPFYRDPEPTRWELGRRLERLKEAAEPKKKAKKK